jgi:hypothetical protein
LNGRNFVQLVALVPGANEGPGNGLSSGGRPDDRRTNAAGLSVNGQDESLNNWVVDGVDDNERMSSAPSESSRTSKGFKRSRSRPTATLPRPDVRPAVSSTSSPALERTSSTGRSTSTSATTSSTAATTSRRQGRSPNCARTSMAAASADPSSEIGPSSTSTTKDSVRSPASPTPAQFQPSRSTTTSTVSTADRPRHCCHL